MAIQSQPPLTNAERLADCQAKLAECRAKLAELESNSSAIEALKELHGTVFQRWQNRRDYEWKLSYAVWGALAAFIAVVIFGKDAQFKVTPALLVVAVVGSIAVVWVQYRYLRQMIERVLDDLKYQYLIEGAIDQQLKEEIFKDRPKFDPKDPKHRYGLRSQVSITILLAAFICFSIWTRLAKPTSDNGDETKNQGTFISTVEQEDNSFSIIESSPVNTERPHTHTFLLNRKTGQLWVMTCHGGSNVQFVKTSVEGLDP